MHMKLLSQVMTDARDDTGLSMGDLTDLVDAINLQTQIDPEELGITLPPVPQAVIGTRTGGDLEPLIDTADGFAAVTQALETRKGY
jgi:hypothetical protein